MELHRSRRLVLASVTAPLVPVLVFVGCNHAISGRFLVVALVVSYVHSAVGICLLLWLRRIGKIGVGTVVTVSGLLGSMPVTVLTYAIGVPDFESVGGVVTVRQGQLTIYGVWEIIRQALSAGGMGVTAGMVWHFACGFGRRHR